VQFGYRYLLDALPYGIILVALGLAEARRGGGEFLLEFSRSQTALGVTGRESSAW